MNWRDWLSEKIASCTLAWWIFWGIVVLIVVMGAARAETPAEKECIFYASAAEAMTFARDGKLSAKARDINWYLARLTEEAPQWGIDKDVLESLQNLALYIYSHPALGSDAAFELILTQCLLASGERKEG